MENYDHERRENARVSIKVDMRVVLFNSGLAGVLTFNQLTALRKGLMVDLSYAGLKMKTNDLDNAWFYHLLSGGIQIAMKFKLPKLGDEISVVAQAAWIDDNPDAEKDGYKYVVGLRFSQIGPTDQEKLADFIANQK